MSGQQFAYNFFDVTNETIVDWHTGDNSLDPLAPSTGSCPYLEQVGYSSSKLPRHPPTTSSRSGPSPSSSSSCPRVWLGQF